MRVETVHRMRPLDFSLDTVLWSVTSGHIVLPGTGPPHAATVRPHSLRCLACAAASTLVQAQQQTGEIFDERQHSTCAAADAERGNGESNQRGRGAAGR